MASWRLFPRAVSAAVLAAVMGASPSAAPQNGVSKDRDKNTQAPADTPAMQAQVAQMQALVRLTDAAMIGQPAPSDFPIQFQNDFIRAQGSRVWVPMTLTIDSAKLTNPSGEPMTLYLRVAPRGMTAPPPPPAAKDADNSPATKDGDKSKDKKDSKKKGTAEPAATPSPYAFEDLAQIEPHPAAPGQPIRIVRGIGVPAGSYDLYVALQERGVPSPKTAVLKQPMTGTPAA